MKYGSLILKNLLRHRRQTTLTILSMAVALFVFTALLSLIFFVYDDPDQTVARYSLTIRGEGGFLPHAYLKQIAGRFSAPEDGWDSQGLDQIAREGLLVDAGQPARIDAMMGAIWAGGAKIGDRELRVAIIDPKAVREIWTDMRSIEETQYKTFLSDRRMAMVGLPTMEELKFKVGDEIEFPLKVMGAEDVPLTVRVKIAGTSQEGKWGDTTYLHRSYIEEFVQKSQVSSIFLNVRHKDDVEKVKTEIEQMFANSNPPVAVGIQQQFLQDMMAVLETLSKLIVAVTIIVVAGILLVVSNSLAMSMRARTSEVAVLKTLGFSRGHVLALLLAESALIGLAGGILGCGGAYLIIKRISFPMSPSGYFNLDPSAVLAGIGVAVLLGMVGGLIPACRAAQLKITDAIRKVT